MKDIKRYLDKFFRELKDLYRTIPQKITDDMIAEHLVDGKGGGLGASLTGTGHATATA